MRKIREHITAEAAKRARKMAGPRKPGCGPNQALPFMKIVPISPQ